MPSSSGTDAFHAPFRPAAWLMVTGEDATSFLQGQCSQDLRLATPAQAVYGLFLDRRGRIEADGFLWPATDAEGARGASAGWRILSYHVAAPVLRARLERFVIADDVTLHEATLPPTGVVVAGPGAAAALAATGLPVPPAPLGLATGPGGILVLAGRRGGGEAWDVLVPATDPVAQEWLHLWPAHAAQAGLRAGTEADLEWRRIAAGLPRVPEDAGPRDLPQEAGLAAVAVHPAKGCYLGQEAMARLQGGGRVRRRPARIEPVPATTPPPPALPARLYTGATVAGEWRTAAARDGRTRGLAVLTTAADGCTHLSSSPGGPSDVRILDSEPPPDLARAFAAMGAPPAQAATFARQLWRRATQVAEADGIPHTQALARLLTAAAAGRAGTYPPPEDSPSG